MGTDLARTTRFDEPRCARGSGRAHTAARLARVLAYERAFFVGSWPDTQRSTLGARASSLVDHDRPRGAMSLGRGRRYDGPVHSARDPTQTLREASELDGAGAGAAVGSSRAGVSAGAGASAGVGAGAGVSANDDEQVPVWNNLYDNIGLRRGDRNIGYGQFVSMMFERPTPDVRRKLGRSPAIDPMARELSSELGSECTIGRYWPAAARAPLLLPSSSEENPAAPPSPGPSPTSAKAPGAGGWALLF